jgi:RNA polymerase sigma-70 factor (ECF subfamily)
MAESEKPPKDRLRSLAAAVRKAWPALDVPPQAFIDHLSARIRDPRVLEPTPGLLDLYLAFACLQGLPPAVEEVERRLRAQASAAGRRLHLTASEVHDLAQELFLAIRIGEDGVPGLANYAGEGPLDAWLASTAFRLGLRGRRKARDGHPEDRAKAAADGWEQADPELDFIKKRYRGHFDAAFRQALAGLSPREKSVLRLYLGGLNIERIGVCYHVHRATVARWISAAREKLLADTRALLADNLDLKSSEVDSLVGLLKSQVDVSISKYLVTSED